MSENETSSEESVSSSPTRPSFPVHPDPTQKTEHISIFSLKLETVTLLKLAIEGLLDRRFNPNESGLVQVTREVGFALLTYDADNNCYAELILPHDAHEFECTTEIPYSVVNLRSVLGVLNAIEKIDHNWISVSGFDDHKLGFIVYGTPDDGELQRVLLDLREDSEIQETSAIILCTVTIPSDDFTVMVEHLLQPTTPGGIQTLTVTVKGTTATLTIGGDNPWEATYDMKTDLDIDMSDTTAEVEHRACFQWASSEFLQKASQFVGDFMVEIWSGQPRYIWLRLHFPEFGELDYYCESVEHDVEEADEVHEEADLVDAVELLRALRE